MLATAEPRRKAAVGRFSARGPLSHPIHGLEPVLTADEMVRRLQLRLCVVLLEDRVQVIQLRWVLLRVGRLDQVLIVDHGITGLHGRRGPELERKSSVEEVLLHFMSMFTSEYAFWNIFCTIHVMVGR